jgi:hypothetical protein
MIMSELSITELQAESVELLPERETLSAIIVEVSQVAVSRAPDSFAANVYAGNPITVTNISHSFDGNHIF